VKRGFYGRHLCLEYDSEVMSEVVMIVYGCEWKAKLIVSEQNSMRLEESITIHR
jgi:hypothetical protein